MKKIYVAGKITGDPNFSEKFAKATKNLQAEGYAVLNPAIIPKGFSQFDYMQICIAMINVCDEVYFLKDYKESEGAIVEYKYAKKCEKVIRFEE